MKTFDYKALPHFEETYILQCGTFYFYKDFIISQINEGEYITWESAQELIEIAISHYGKKINLSLISNRYNDYDIKYEDWEKFYKEGFQLKALAIVAYTKNGLMDFMIEKKKFRHKIRNFYKLEKAIEWITSME
ncbi:hypothetical protein [uncultured Dokdonia sp.]|uniref:hypothetical protein n=1 Tax=uncultured Dokdonia sp. TaxID=575653 RepID=UPI0026033724|nr:hypothetical protein [uncultured Dokdonia sp.]